MSGSVPILFQPTEIAAFAFLRRACSPFSPGWGGEPLHPAQLELFGSRRRRVVDVKFARPRPGDVVSFDFYDLDGAALPAGDVDDDGVSGSHRTVSLSSVSVDLDPAALTRGLGLRAALEETRHVEPDVESNRCVLSPHFSPGFVSRATRRRGQAGFLTRGRGGVLCGTLSTPW
jgi:hypothetical protein